MGFCDRTSNPNSGNAPAVDVDQAITTCDLYLMDTVTEELLPNRRYRIIDGATGNTILGTSDADAKISNKFRQAYVEVLPVTNKKYLEDTKTASVIKLSNQDKGKIIEVEEDLLKAAAATAPAGITPDANVNVAYMNWLRDKRGKDPWTEYTNATVTPYSYITSYYSFIATADIQSVDVLNFPSVPDKARLISVDDLMNNFTAGITDLTEYKYLKGLTTSSDPSIVNVFDNQINSGNLPSHYYYVLGHGNPSIFASATTRYDKADPVAMVTLISEMKNNGYTNNHTIVFLACNLASGENSFTQVFSELEGIGTVYGYTGYGAWDRGQSFRCGTGFNVHYLSPTVANPSNINEAAVISKNQLIGDWRIFNTATAVKIN